jgi:enolase
VHSALNSGLKGLSVTDQTAIDRKMIEQIDGTQNEWGWCKQKVGANAILAVSLALARAGAAEKKIPLYQHLAELAGNRTDKFITPVPSLNIINGGAHAGNNLEIQEFMILPTGAPNFREAIRYGAETYHALAKLLKKKYGKSAANVGDEGGFGAPQIQDENETLELIMEAIKSAGHEGKIDIGLDVAASEFYDSKTNKYNMSQKSQKNDRIFTPDQMIDLYGKLIDKYPIKTIEDPFDQDDFDSYVKMN